MRCLLIFSLLLVLIYAAPQSKLQYENVGTVSNGKQFIEEVVVESTLHIRSPADRQARTNVMTNLQDGTRIAELKSN